MLTRAHEFADPASLAPGGKQARGWTISLGKSVQHFNNADLGGEDCGGGGEYTAGAARVEGTGCADKVCWTQHEEALAELRELGLPLAVLGGDWMYDIGGAHVTVPPTDGKKISQDCTHWCAPGEWQCL